MRLLKILFLFLFIASGVFAQSKTEDAEDNLNDSEGVPSIWDGDNNESDDDDETEGFGDFLFGGIFRGITNVVVSTFLNLPFDENGHMQNVYYVNYPYLGHKNNSFRVLRKNRVLLTQTDLSVGKGIRGAFNSYSFNSRLHLYGWAFDLKYQYLNEYRAPYPMQYFSGQIFRKSRAFENMDMGFAVGYGAVKINNNYYAGPELGYNLDLFLVRPISLNFNPTVMFYKSEVISNISTSVNVHLKNYIAGVKYQFLNVAGVPFNSLSLKFGFFL